VHHDLPPTERFVRDAACVAAVDMPRAVAAGRAPRRRGSLARLQMHGVVEHQHTLGLQTGEMREKDSEAQKITPGAVSTWQGTTKV
jgi:hypothetical protein